MKANIIEKFLNLHSLINSLNKNEATILKKYLLAFEESKSRYNKSYDLFLYLREKSIPSIEDVKSKLAISSSDTFRKLMDRLFDKYIQSLCLDVSMNKSRDTSLALIAEMEIYKLLYSIDFCYLSGSSNKEVLRHLNRAIKKAYKFEQFHLVLSALYKKQKIVHNKINQINDEIINVQDIIKTLNCCNNVVCQGQFNFLINRRNNANELKRIILTIKPLLNYNKFRLFDFQLNVLLIESSGNLKKLIKHNVNFIDFASSVKVIYCPQLLISIYVKQSDCYFFLEDINTSLEFISKAKKVCVKHRITNVKLLFKEAFLLFFAGSFKESDLLIKKLLEKDILTLIDSEKLLFISACIAFKQKDFESSSLLVSQIKRLKKEMSCWNFSIRVLQILACMEVEETKDLAIDYLETLRRYSSRSLINQHIKLKCKLIVRIVNAIQREGYDFDRVLLKEKCSIEQLVTLESSFYDNFNSSSYILFSDWLIAKIEGKGFYINKI